MTNPHHLVQGFTEWLTLLQHHQSTIDNSPQKIKEFLDWLENPASGQARHQISITEITSSTLSSYMHYLSQRKNKRRAGGLSANYLNMHITSLTQFSTYLQQSQEQGFIMKIPRYKAITQRAVLTPVEINALYQATTPDAMGLRDRAILGIYYGCGLRRSEGAALDVEDLLLRKRLLYVRKGKNYRERYVPVTGRVFTDLLEYIQLGRPCFSPKNDDISPTTGGTSLTALLLSRQYKRLNTQSIYERVLQLKEKTPITKQIGLHTLRHSIATHLLQSGMKLPDISRFLGHRSIESTQIYTHITSETANWR